MTPPTALQRAELRALSLLLDLHREYVEMERTGRPPADLDGLAWRMRDACGALGMAVSAARARQAFLTR